jgi:type VI secretion system secreted protein Hcp
MDIFLLSGISLDEHQNHSSAANSIKRLNMKISRYIGALALASTFYAPVASLAAVDMFLKIEGVTGESKDKGHEGEIDVLAWSWGASSSVKGKAVSCNIQDLSLTKYVDSASPHLLMGQLDGAVYDEAKLTVRQSGGDNPLEFIVIKFYGVRVTSLSTGGSGGEDRLTENITLNFTSADYAYTPQDDKGGAGGAIMASIAGC